MEIQISRQAVCAADDQCGPLDMIVQIDPSGSIQELIETLERTNFLPFSSSHTSIIGVSDDTPVVRVHSRFFSQKQNEYFAPATSPVSEVVKNGHLHFKFQYGPSP